MKNQKIKSGTFFRIEKSGRPPNIVRDITKGVIIFLMLPLMLSIKCLAAEPERQGRQQRSFEDSFKEFSKRRDFQAIQEFKEMGGEARLRARQKARDKQIGLEEREAAINLLEAIDDGEATDDLMRILGDKSEDAYLRQQVGMCLYRAGRKRDRNAFQQLKNLAEREKDVSVKRNMIMALGRVGQNDSMSYLKGVIDGQEDEKVKASAIYGLGAIEDEAVTDTLIRGLDTDSSSLTMEYARVLGRMKKAKRAVGPLLKKLGGLEKTDEERDQLLGSKKMVIYEALGEIGDKVAIPELRSRLSSEDFLDAFYAAMALGKLGDLDSLTFMINRANSSGEASFAGRLKNAYRETAGKEYVE